MPKVILSLGANIGPIEENFKKAICGLKLGGLDDLKLSKLYKNPAFGCPPDTPDFYNMAVSGFWSKTANQLLKICKNLEVNAGRPAIHRKWSSRTLDIDIVFFGDKIISTKNLKIPHKEAMNRIFVILPAAEIEPDYYPPGSSLNLAQILSEKFSYKLVKNLSANAKLLDFF